MDEFEFARSVTIGQYVPGSSLIHRLDARAKIIAFVALIAAVITQASYLGNAAALVAVAFIVLASQIPFGYVLSGIRPIVPVLIVYTAFNFLFLGNYDPTGSAVIWQQSFGIGPVQFPLTVTENSIRQTIQGVMRVTDLVLLSSALTLTTTITATAKSIEWLLAPFRRLRVPGHEIAMVLAIAYRFMPTVAEELERLMKAQASRGANFGSPGAFRFVQRARQLIPITVPLFVSAFRRAEDLIIAMEARCYVGGAGRARVRLGPLTGLDWSAMAVAWAFALALSATRFPI